MSRYRDTWYYPQEIANDLNNVDLPTKLKEEVFACAWEYTRCVIPQYTNWNRYVAFMRIIIMGIIAEFRGSMVDVTAGDNILGYSLDGTLAALFAGTKGHELMAREYKTFLLVTADKASERRSGELFRRYVNALAESPRHWFRMRDCDALARFTIASALACNDLDDVWFTDEQFEILTEMGDTLYDAVAFYKHRSEGETNSSFAYMPPDQRTVAFARCREVLWALDVAWARNPEGPAVINFTRFFGGPIHMMMRRYRFVEEDLTIGTPETAHVVDETRRNFKLWNRVDARRRNACATDTVQRYRDLVASRSHDLMFPGLAALLEAAGDGHCDHCLYRDSYGAETTHCFGGVQLCDNCRASWRTYLESFPERAAKVFPEISKVRDDVVDSVDIDFGVGVVVNLGAPDLLINSPVWDLVSV
ncbi:BcABA3 [Bisporella sp. PMI_857]|nr:BcABA3 [Bisporella sp. PMI_857]